MPLPRHLAELEAEAIHILRETAAGFVKPVLLYSIGKDSSVLLHLARKAFFPGTPPFRFLHVDTTWKFRDMIKFRDETKARFKLDLIVHTSKAGIARGLKPYGATATEYTRVMKTEALREALDQHGFDAAIGGARRDEESSRAKERVFSVRGPGHRWEPRRQRPELWRLYNTHLSTGETMRVFPLSNWTEIDIWEYILAEKIKVVPLYFAAHRPVVDRDRMWIVVDDDRMPLKSNETPKEKLVRFRSLGCYPLSAAIESTAATVKEIVAELKGSRMSERSGRLIDTDQLSSMEKKKREGYF